MKKPLVSIIITTKNEEKNIANCLESVQTQTYAPIQSIVVDNNSTDATKKIAKRYTKFVYNKGPERSAQRNFGAQKALGEYLLIIDCDMILTPKVVEQCIEKMKQTFGALVIPEVSFGIGFWASAKSLERSFYLGDENIEAARFFPKKIFFEFGGFDEGLTGPEDWDLSQRIGKKYKLGRIAAFIRHNEGQLSLVKTIQKKYYYSKKFGPYLMKSENKKNSSQQFSIVGRYSIFFKQPKKLFKDPVLGFGMLFMKTSEFVAGGLGYIHSKIK
jgi:glycosyltransferase involved in cell wall biosynthesis